jgi:hypothetical protein
MSATKRTARLAGVLYLAMSILSFFGYLYVPARFYVADNAVATVGRITEGMFLYRMGILSSLVGQVLFLFVALSLYELFKDIDKVQARALLILVCVGVAAEITNLLNRAAPLILVSGAGFLSVFSKDQLDAMALGFLRLGNSLGDLVTLLWGLWLFPFGILTIRSHYFPRFLGVLLFVSGFAYVVTSITAVALPARLDLVSRLMSPLYFGEVVMVLWLPIIGARVPAQEARAT